MFYRLVHGFLLSLLVVLAFTVSCAPGGGEPVRETVESGAQTVAGEAREAGVAGEPVGEVYVSLGDSLAVGVGSTEPDRLGYTPLYREALEEEAGAGVDLIGLGIPGETSASFVGEYPSGDSQLVQAEAALAENPGAEVTLSLGGNDLLRAGETAGEREAAVVAYGENLDFILGTLEAASPGEPPRITVLALYNPAPGTFTDRWAGQLNREIRAVAQENGALVAAGDRAFEGNESDYARFEQYPWDIHPTDEGYRALAGAFAEARGIQPG
ncbi:GDSL-like Lipase/Acylhydrolase family [Rubrobacter radiotolerans]|uniref:GDSL-like Lipase/Acylhydrolase family n=1 Tax=Rubrobacter radiotolerans TaxID=42256 RepID=A0A023X577_RUBRA|nr:SGNH/GDSL hydrolase family protein [Rubrobacter radiotolerans]AHY47376.1 GDSL-like Lipase/Acylhydrolase family [Rubrobacter radiotolerans]MDX5894780.1 SGNH/GDSL hydrolase family protein [Rubrobacter radiotolerans]SMC06755.1 Lysophospholipase L1 [Rubrobacter radiotolerans DSM 5868]